MAWRLDGHLQFNGHTIDPPGSWVGLTAGRPPVVAEVVYSWLDAGTDPPRDLRSGSRFSSPAMAEPAAIAIGLIAAGVAIDVATLVEARDPLVGGLPEHLAISQVNGQTIASQDDWWFMIDGLGPRNEIVTAGGQVVVFEGQTFPYRRVDLMQSPTDLSVSLAGWGSLIPENWYRNLSLGRSHGLLLALAAYADVAGVDLADGRVIAATGVIRGDGTVGGIGGLPAKAKAADRAGVDVLIYPREQQCEETEIKESLGSTSMRMVAVGTLAEAIDSLGPGASPTSHDPGTCET